MNCKHCGVKMADDFEGLHDDDGYLYLYCKLTKAEPEPSEPEQGKEEDKLTYLELVCSDLLRRVERLERGQG